MNYLLFFFVESTIANIRSYFNAFYLPLTGKFHNRV
jgi:hypothetical protein